MDVSQDFLALTMSFHQDATFLFQSDSRVWTEEALRYIRPGRMQALKAEIDAILSANHDWKTLREMWSETYADFSFRDEKSFRGFLKLVSDHIETNGLE